MAARLVLFLAATFASAAAACAAGPYPTPFPSTSSGQAQLRAGSLPDGEGQVVEFDSARAFAHLEAQVAFGPRVPGTSGHAAARQYLIDTLAYYVDELLLQEFEVPLPGPPSGSPASGLVHPNGSSTLLLTNIIGVLNPEAPYRVLVAAHWDTRPTADMERDPALRMRPIDGANDGASGVAVALELARALSESRASGLGSRVEPPTPVGVVFVLLDGEDYGPDTDMMFLGSRALRQAQGERPPLLDPRPAFGILLDMVGDADLELPLEPNSLRFAPDVVELVWSTAERLGERAFTRRVGPTIIDDHVYLTAAGIPTIDIIDFSYPYWHTLGDTVDKTSAESLRAVGRVVLEVIRECGLRNADCGLRES